MKAFTTYTLARFGLFILSYVVLWGVGSLIWNLPPMWNVFHVDNLIVVLAALMVSSVIALVALGKMREQLASTIQARATVMHERIEESRRAEDVD